LVSHKIDFNLAKLYHKVDLAVLDPSFTKDHYLHALKLAKRYNCASVCIPVEKVIEWNYQYARKSKVPLAVTVNFPLGYIENPKELWRDINAANVYADEMDIVVPVSLSKWDDYYLNAWLAEVRFMSKGHLIKAILETGYLTSEEIEKVSWFCAKNKIDFIKTCTGFGPRGAYLDDLTHMRIGSNDECKIKASGGIKSLLSAKDFLSCGAERLGIGLKSFESILKEVE
jgi:deoxyribose-phosphate aldolase